MFTQAQVDNSVRKALTPTRLTTYLPEGSSYTTPTLTAGQWTKVLISTTQKFIQDFELDVPNNRYKIATAGISNRKCSVNMAASISSSSSNHTVEFAMFKNGVLETGVYGKRWIAAGADVGSIAVSGAFEISTDDYIEVYVKDSVNGTITFEAVSINIMEEN